MYTNLITERLTLRRISLADAEFMLNLVNSQGWLEFIGDRNISNQQEAEQYIQKILSTDDFYYSVFELKETSKPIGIITFLKREDEVFPDIGFALLPQFGSKGYTFEACKTYLEKIEQVHAYENIIAVTKPDNVKSINLLKKLGLQYSNDKEKGEETLSYFSLK
ncbi:MAG: GNAT family N-acetyltransferase [Crocinitomicaceae bacterium]